MPESFPGRHSARFDLRGWRVRRERWLIGGEMRKVCKTRFLFAETGREKPVSSSSIRVGRGPTASAPRGWRGRNERRWRSASPVRFVTGMRTHGGSTRPQKVHDFTGSQQQCFRARRCQTRATRHQLGRIRASSTLARVGPSDMAFPLATASGGGFASAFRRPRASPRAIEPRARASPRVSRDRRPRARTRCSNRVARAVGRPRPSRRDASRARVVTRAFDADRPESARYEAALRAPRRTPRRGSTPSGEANLLRSSTRPRGRGDQAPAATRAADAASRARADADRLARAADALLAPPPSPTPRRAPTLRGAQKTRRLVGEPQPRRNPASRAPPPSPPPPNTPSPRKNRRRTRRAR